MNLRRSGARLAVLLITIGFGGLVAALTAAADDGCVLTPTGIDCGYGGTTTTTITITTLPPLRYLATTDHPTVGRCWYWSRFPPGYDSWDPAYDQSIILTRSWYPECPTGGGTTVVSATSRAWEVFRSFALLPPNPRIRPTVGITNLASIVTVSAPATLDHRETLPDGRVLEVQATVGAVRVRWGDETPVIDHPAGPALTDGIAHIYRLKTCPNAYRSSHPSGPNCHPTLLAYPVEVTFVWTGRYRTDGAWIVLGALDRSSSFAYDVDEVVGVPVR